MAVERAANVEKERESTGRADELVAKAAAGDAYACRRIYEAHATPILRRLWRLVGDRARAEELCQETFLIAFDRLDRFGGRSKLSTWLHGIAFNLAREDIDRHRRRRSLWSRFRGLDPANADDADAKVVHDDLVARLRRAMDQLGADQREAYVLRVVEGLSLEQCAELLTLPVSTVSYRARRAEEIVRRHFEREESK